MARKFLPFRSLGKKWTSYRGSLQFLIGFSEKLMFHLIFKQNFGIFWLSSKHPLSSLFFVNSLDSLVHYHLKSLIPKDCR